MTRNYLYLQRKRITRSSFWQKNFIINIIIGILIFFIVIELFFVGMNMPYVLSKIDNNTPPWQLLDKFLIYYFIFIFVLRFFLQNLPTLEIRPLLHLPLTKRSISLFLSFRSLTSFFNFLPLLLFLPFAINYLPKHYSHIEAFSWFAAIFLFEISSNFLLVKVKRQTTVNPYKVLIILGIIILLVVFEKFQLFSFTIISSWYFNELLTHPLWVLLPLFTLLFFFYENFNYTIKHCYLDEISSQKKHSENFSTYFKNLENRGKVSILILNEIKLIIRNKRSKQMLFFTLPLIIFYAFLIYQQSNSLNNYTLLVMIGVFFTGGFLFSYGQYMLAWDSNNFDFILTANFKTNEFFTAKYYLMTMFTLLFFLITVPFVYFGVKILIVNMIMLFYNIGINIPIILFLSSYNRKRMDLDRGQIMNYQGVGINNFINIIPLLGLPMIIYLFFNAIFGQIISLILISALGITGIIFYKQLITLVSKFYIKKRYKIANGYRNS